jgi:TP901 family phage tail tape measure protein
LGPWSIDQGPFVFREVRPLTDANLNIKILAENLARAAFGQAEKDVTSLHDRLSGFASSMAATGTMLTAGLTVPLVAIGASAIKTAADFEGSMNLLQAASGATVDQMGQLSALAKQLGADMDLPATSASDAGTAMLELAKAGLSVNDVMAASKGVLQLAAAGAISEGDAAKVTANALHAFGLEGTDASRIANLLANAANSATGDVSDFALGLQQASSMAHASKVPLEDTITALGILANRGQSGSVAGTNLGNAFERMINPTDKAAKIMKELGISAYDSSGTMKALPDILDNINAATGGLTDQAKNAALAEIFMINGFQAMQPLLEAGSAGFADMKANVEKAGGAADMAAARMKGFNGALEGLQSVWQTVLLEAGAPFLNMLSEIVRKVADVLPGLLNLDPTIRNIGLGFAAVLAVAGPFALALSGLAAAAAFVLTGFGALTVAVGLLGAAFASDFGGIRTAVTETFGSIMATMHALQADEGLGGLDALLQAVSMQMEATFGPQTAALFQSLTQKIGDFSSAFGENLHNIVDYLGLLNGEGGGFAAFVEGLAGGFNRAGQAIEAVGQKFSDLGSRVQEGLQGWGALFDAIGQKFSELGSLAQAGIQGWGSLFDTIGTTAHNIVAAIGGAFSGLGSLAQEGLRGWGALFDAMGTAIQGFVQSVGSTFSTIGTVVHDALAALPGQIGDAFSGLGSAVQRAMDDIRSKVTETWDRIPEDIRADLELIVGTLVDRGIAMVASWKQTWDDFLDIEAQGIANIITDLIDGWNTVTSTVGDAMSGLGTVARTVWDGISSTIGNAMSEIGSTVHGAWDGITGAIGAALSEIGSTVHGAWDGITGAIGAALSEISSAIAAKWAEIQNTTSEASTSIGQTISEAWGNFASLIGEALAAALAKVTEWAGGVLSALGGLASSVGATARNIGAAIVQGIQAGVEAASDAVGGALGGVIRQALGIVKAVAEIQSPSRLFQREVGEPIVAGIAAGIESGAGKVYEATQSFFNAVMDVARDSDMIGAFGQAGSKAISAMVEAIDTNSKQAGSAAGNAIQKMIEDAEKAGVPQARELGARIIEVMGAAINTGSPELLAQAEGMIAELFQAMGEAAQQAGRDKLMAAFGKSADDALQSLRVKLSPELGGGIMNVFMEQMAESINNGSQDVLAGVTRFAGNMIKTLEQKLSPEDASAAIEALMAAMNEAWATGDFSGLESFWNDFGDVFADGFDKAKKHVRTAAESLLNSVSEVARDSRMELQFGAAGAKAVQAIGEAFASGSVDAAAKAGNAIQSMIGQAEKVGVPGARELGAVIIQMMAEGLETGDQGLIDQAKALMGDLFTATQGAAEDQGAAKLAAGFKKAGDAAMDAIMLTISPEKGGGLVNVFMGAVNAMMDNKGPETIARMGNVFQSVLAAVKSKLSPENAALATADFNEAMQALLAGNVAPLQAAIATWGPAINGSLTTVLNSTKALLQSNMHDLADVVKSQAQFMTQSFGEGVSGMAPFIDKELAAIKAAVAAMGPINIPIQYGGGGGTPYQPGEAGASSARAGPGSCRHRTAGRGSFRIRPRVGLSLIRVGLRLRRRGPR